MPTIAHPGDVVLVRFPFTDLTTTTLRPGSARRLGSLSAAQMKEVKESVKLALNLD